MGREIAEAVPEAMEVFERRQRGVRARPRSSSASRRRSRSSSRPRCSSRRSSRRASRSSPRCATRGHRARLRRRPLGRRVRGARGGRRRSATREAIALVRERGLAMAEAARERPGSMAAILGLEDEVGRDALPQDPRRLAGELQLPRADRRLGRERCGRGVLRRGREPRRPPSRQAEGLGRVPLARSSRARPSGCARRSSAIRFAEPRRAVHVDGDREDRAGAAHRRAARRPADRAGASSRRRRASSSQAA